MILKQKTSTKIKYPIRGYAPGYYMFTCVHCKEQFTGAKYSSECEPCAINTLNADSVQNIRKYTELKNVVKSLQADLNSITKAINSNFNL